MNDFKAEPAELSEAMLAAAKRVIESGWYVLGNEVVAFETLWAKNCGVAFGVGVANGMDAIEITLRALGIGEGDEVITTPMTAFATVLAILRAGATPVLADIETGTSLLSLESAKRCVGPKTKAIILVHLYGQLRNMDAWVKLCDEKGIYLVEDCAQSHLASWQGKVSGSFGVAGTFSFYPTKNLGAPGDAGMLVSNDEKITNRARCLRNYGQSVRYYHPDLGLNSRLDEIQAAILTERLKWLNEFTARRREIAAAYRCGIKNKLVNMLLEPEEPSAHVYHLFVITCAKRDALQEHLQYSDIQTLIHYPVPVHLQLTCKEIKRDPLGLGLSEKHAAECLSLPCHPQLTDDEVKKIIECINSFK